MATAVGMNFKMTASIAKFQASMDKVEEKLKNIERSGKQTASGMKLLAGIEVGKLLVSGLTSVVGIMQSGVSTVTQFASEAAAAADAIGKLSSMTGMAEEPLQVFTQLASYSGVSSTQFGDALQKMSRGLGEAANGTGTAARGLEQLGLSVDSLLSLSPSEQFLKIGQAIGEIEDPTRRSAVAADIFGRSGTKLIPMFEDLEVNAKATAAEMLELGQVLSGTQVDNIEAMNDSFEKVRQTAFKIGSQVVANFAPAITEANSALIELIKNFEYEGVKGGQGLANYLTEAFFTGVDKLTAWADYLLNGLKSFVQGASEVAALLLESAAGLADWVASDETVDGLNAAAEKAREFGKSLDGVSSNLNGFANETLSGFKTAATEASDSLAELFAKTDATTETMQDWVTNGLNANAAMQDLTSGIVNAAQVVPISLRELGAATERAVMSLDISSAAESARAALEVLKDPTQLVAQGMGWMEKQLLEIIGPMGWTKDAILELGQAAAQRKNWTDQMLKGHMDAWDRAATMVRDKLIRQGMNPYTAHQMMMEARAKELGLVTEHLKKLEHEHIRNTGVLTGSVDELGKKLSAGATVIGEKFSEAATSAAEWATGLAKDAGDWLGGLFGGGEGDAGPTIPEPETTLPELQRQSGTLDGILTAVQGFGANFVQATF